MGMTATHQIRVSALGNFHQDFQASTELREKLAMRAA
jgi:hypothetical protein